jgi:hypothetical protein
MDASGQLHVPDAYPRGNIYRQLLLDAMMNDLQTAVNRKSHLPKLDIEFQSSKL